MVTGAEAAEMYTTHGFPPELFETLAAEHNLGFDWARLQPTRWSSTASRAAPASGWSCSQSSPLDALKKTLPGTRVPRL